MKLLLEIFILPVCVGLIITWGILGLVKGSAVYNDYAWLIGIIVTVAGIYISSRITALRKKIDELENLLGIRRR